MAPKLSSGTVLPPGGSDGSVHGGVEDVVRRVRHKRLTAHFVRGATAARGGESAGRAYALDECRLAQSVAAAGSILRADLLKQNPGNRASRHEVRIGRRTYRLAPHGAAGSRVFPGSANGATFRLVRAEVVGRELQTVVVEQGGPG